MKEFSRIWKAYIGEHDLLEESDADMDGKDDEEEEEEEAVEYLEEDSDAEAETDLHDAAKYFNPHNINDDERERANDERGYHSLLRDVDNKGIELAVKYLNKIIDIVTDEDGEYGDVNHGEVLAKIAVLLPEIYSAMPMGAHKNDPVLEEEEDEDDDEEWNKAENEREEARDRGREAADKGDTKEWNKQENKRETARDKARGLEESTHLKRRNKEVIRENKQLKEDLSLILHRLKDSGILE